MAAEAALQGAAPTKYPGCDARGRNPAGELVDWLGTRHVYYATKEDADDALCAVRLFVDSWGFESEENSGICVSFCAPGD